MNELSTSVSISHVFSPLHLFPCSFVIRGDKDEQAVLCGKDKTYDLKIADTSNMLLVIPGCKTAEQLKREETQENIVHTEVLLFGPIPVSEHGSLCSKLAFG